MNLVILLLWNLLMSSSVNKVEESIIEEANPIRIDERIKAIDYDIKFRNINRERIVYDTKIIESINHYLDTSKEKEFLIKLKLNNDTQNKYYLKKIVICDNNGIIKVYNYNKLIKNTTISVNLSKEILNKIIKNKGVTGIIKIIIEK